MAVIFSSGFELQSSDSVPLDVSKNMFLVIKCPNCQKLIRFSMGGTHGEGWGLRTFYCKACNQTHAITMNFKVSKGLEKTSHWKDLTQSLWRASGVRYLKQAHKFIHGGAIKIDNPAKVLGLPSNKIAEWLRGYLGIILKHLESTQKESKLHPIEQESIYLLISKLNHLRNRITLFIKEI